MFICLFPSHLSKDIGPWTWTFPICIHAQPFPFLFSVSNQKQDWEVKYFFTWKERWPFSSSAQALCHTLWSFTDVWPTLKFQLFWIGDAILAMGRWRGRRNSIEWVIPLIPLCSLKDIYLHRYKNVSCGTLKSKFQRKVLRWFIAVYEQTKNCLAVGQRVTHLVGFIGRRQRCFYRYRA